MANILYQWASNGVSDYKEFVTCAQLGFIFVAQDVK